MGGLLPPEYRPAVVPRSGRAFLIFGVIQVTELELIFYRNYNDYEANPRCRDGHVYGCFLSAGDFCSPGVPDDCNSRSDGRDSLSRACFGTGVFFDQLLRNAVIPPRFLSDSCRPFFLISDVQTLLPTTKISIIYTLVICG